MPLINYIPATDVDFNLWAINYSALITATPTAFGLVAGQATALAALVTTYSAALATATNPATRTKPTVAAKDSARFALEAYCRLLANIIQAFPTITNTQLANLGLTVRATSPTPIPAPVTRPILAFVAIGSLSATMRYSDETTPDSRAKPFGAIRLYYGIKYGLVAPVTLDDCTEFNMATKNPVAVAFPGGQVLQKAWFIGAWQTRTGLLGPQSTPIYTTVAA